MDDQKIDLFYEIFASNYRRRFVLRLNNNDIKKGIVRLCKKKDFHLEITCGKENAEEDLFVINFPYPYEFDYEENSLLLDYRNATLFKQRPDVSEIMDTVLTDSDRHHRFYDKIAEVEFYENE